MRWGYVLMLIVIASCREAKPKEPAAKTAVAAAHDAGVMRDAGAVRDAGASVTGNSATSANDASPRDAGMNVRSCPPGTSKMEKPWTYGQPQRQGRQEWCELPDGTKHGYWTWWWSPDMPKEIGAYEQGKKTGVWKEYFRVGGLYMEGAFVDGQKHGLWKTYDGEGALAQEHSFDRGIRVGKDIQYWPNGKISEIGERVAGKPHGEWLSYDLSGKLERKEVYEHGKAVAAYELRGEEWVRVEMEDGVEDQDGERGNGPYVPPGAYGGDTDAEFNPGDKP